MGKMRGTEERERRDGGRGVCIHLKLSAGDLELKVNSDGVEGMERFDTAPGLGGSCKSTQHSVPLSIVDCLLLYLPKTPPLEKHQQMAV